MNDELGCQDNNRKFCKLCFRNIGTMSEADTTASNVGNELQKLRLKAVELCQLSLSRSAISGMPKLIRKCKAELQFVERVSKLRSALFFRMGPFIYDVHTKIGFLTPTSAVHMCPLYPFSCKFFGFFLPKFLTFLFLVFS